MQRRFLFLMLLTGIGLQTFAQETMINHHSEDIFDIPSASFQRSYSIELGKGNRIYIELAEFNDISTLKNLDSLLNVFLADITPLKDSLQDELTSKRIDYLIDMQGRKKIRLQIYKPKGNSYLLNNGDLAALKLEQDTINIIGQISTEIKAGTNKKPAFRYYRLRFILNQLSDLNSLLSLGMNYKISSLLEANRSKWKQTENYDWRPVNGNTSIHASHPGGYAGGGEKNLAYNASGKSNDMLALTASISIQNYKNYFAPSININARMIFTNPYTRREMGFAWEPFYLFAKNTQGNLQAYRNDFITFTYSYTKTVEKWPSFNPFDHVSIGYLISQKGDFFDPHTIKISTGGFNWYEGRLKLEPVLYLPNIFTKHSGITTPGLRLTVSF
jgi:hypothetical protein